MPRRLLITAVLSLALGAATTASVSATPGHVDSGDAAKGRSYKGLVKADSKHCKGHGFYLADHPEVCTHGPDDAPTGVDVRTRRSTAELQAAGKWWAWKQQQAPTTPSFAPATTAASPPPAAVVPQAAPVADPWAGQSQPAAQSAPSGAEQKPAWM